MPSTVLSIPAPEAQGGALAVAIVVVGDETYGVQRFVASFIQALIEQGARPTVIALEPGPMFQACVAAGAEGALCPTGPPADFGGIADALRVARHTLRSVRQLANMLKRIGPGAVIVRTSYLVPLVALAARRTGCASFWLLPNLVSDRYPLSANKLLYDLVMGACGMVPIANSHFTRTSLRNLLAPARVAHLGINPEEFDPSLPVPLTRGQFGLTDRDAVFGIFARLIPYKGQKLLIEAVAARSALHPDLKLLICGGPTAGPYFDELIQAIARHGLTGRIVLAGPVQDVRSHLALCDVVANVRLDPEPFGLSVIEAMLMAKPVLVHALGGPAETVLDGSTGWHVAGPTVAAFADGLDAAFRVRKHWPAMGQAARRHALAHYTHRHATKRILAIIGEARPRREVRPC